MISSGGHQDSRVSMYLMSGICMLVFRPSLYSDSFYPVHVLCWNVTVYISLSIVFFDWIAIFLGLKVLQVAMSLTNCWLSLFYFCINFKFLFTIVECFGEPARCRPQLWCSPTSHGSDEKERRGRQKKERGRWQKVIYKNRQTSTSQV